MSEKEHLGHSFGWLAFSYPLAIQLLAFVQCSAVSHTVVKCILLHVVVRCLATLDGKELCAVAVLPTTQQR